MTRNFAAWWIASGFLIAIGTGIAVAMGVVPLDQLGPKIADLRNKVSGQDVQAVTEKRDASVLDATSQMPSTLQEGQATADNRTKMPAATSVQTVRVPTSTFPPRVFESELSKPDANDIRELSVAHPKKGPQAGELKTGTTVRAEKLVETVNPADEKVTKTIGPATALEIPIGKYSIQIDVVEQSTGRLLVSTKVPIERAPNQPAQLQPDGVNRIMVREGDTLWRIAKRKYGDGEQYLRIFEANRDRLPSPDLVEVGQVLQLPK